MLVADDADQAIGKKSHAKFPLFMVLVKNL